MDVLHEQHFGRVYLDKLCVDFGWKDRMLFKVRANACKVQVINLQQGHAPQARQAIDLAEQGGVTAGEDANPGWPAL